jgi:microcystin-dependent protein
MKMSEPFLGQIEMFAFNFAPRGWATCDGQILPINQYQSLFSLLGTTYGGDGRTTFGLPDLRGRAPMHEGTGPSGTRTLGAKGGSETVPLTTGQIPAHTHAAMAKSSAGDNPNPGTRVLANSAPSEVYHDPTSLSDLRSGTITNAGSSQGHENMQPYLTITFCIALQGLFPSRN